MICIFKVLFLTFGFHLILKKIHKVQIYRSLDNYNIENTYLSIGIFDGLHLGHQKLISRLVELAKAKNTPTTLLTFWPHPKIVLSGNSSDIKLLNTIDEKISLIKKLGIDNLIIYPFSKEFSKFSAKDFIEKILVEKIKIKALIIGYDHSFGHKQKGENFSISAQAEKHGFYLEKIKAFEHGDITVSSTKIRNALNIGNIELANKYLSYNYHFFGKVIHGKRLGNKIGFPTANIKIDQEYKLIPANGVYAVELQIKDNIYNGMMNIGYKPTINNLLKEISIEVNIFNFDDNIYGKEVKIIFLARIRDERKFANLEELKTQLKKDKDLCLSIYFSD